MTYRGTLRLLLPILILGMGNALTAQRTPDAMADKTGGSPKVRVLSHIALDGYFRVGGIEIEAELARPFVYVTRMLDQAGFTVIDVTDATRAKVIYDWRVPDLEAHSGLGGENGKYFKTRGRYYFLKTMSFETGSPDADLGGVVFDVTGLPDGSRVKEVARIRGGGTTHVFPYKHSDGRVLAFTTPRGPYANAYDLDKLLSGDPAEGLIGRVPVPDAPTAPIRAQDGTLRLANYHDTYVAYDPATRQDKLYGAGHGGFHIFDVTRPEEPKHLTSLSPGAGVSAGGHTIIPTPDGRYAVAQVERQYWPVMIFDLKPGLERQVPIPAPIGAWTADWRDASHTNDVRWPFVFVASFEDGLQIFNMTNPAKPKTVGWYYTCECEHQTGWGGLRNPRGTSVMNGAADVDIRNADGLIVMTDYNTGFWAFRMEGFDGWNGKDWAVPNISSEQDWDRGPFGAPRPIRSSGR